jgi:hypothetical protein
VSVVINNEIDYEIEVYKCRLCGHIETVSTEIGLRPLKCEECRLEASYVLVDIVPGEDHVALR